MSAPDDLSDFQAIAEWAADLRERLARARLIFLYVNADHDFEPLLEEQAALKRIISVLGWKGPK